jgi:DNA-directed RNA polymerase subunit K/omega
VAVSDEQIIEKVFKSDVNDYITVLAVARRARQILDEYPKYKEALDAKGATALALEEYLNHEFEFEFAPGKKPAGD